MAEQKILSADNDYKELDEYLKVAEGVKLFRSANCSMIIAVGGGSAIDTAKSEEEYGLRKVCDGKRCVRFTS